MTDDTQQTEHGETRKRVLLVDDVELFLELQKTFFRRRDIDLLVARNGEEAYREVVRRRPDVVFMDQHMPRMNGDECCRKIKENPDLKHIPVIMVTSASKPDDLERCRDAGADAIILKPINRHHFLETARTFLHMPVRIAPRVEVKLPVRYGVAGHVERTAYSFNFSTGGVFVQTDELFDLNTPLHLAFSLPAQNLDIKCAGRVAWLNRPEGGGQKLFPMGMGIQFVGLDLVSLDALREFVKGELVTPPASPRS